MTTRIPTTKREKWHRKEDRWTWKSVYRTWSSPNKPRWAGTTWHLDPNANATLERLESETTLAQRRASLRRIAPAAKARKVKVPPPQKLPCAGCGKLDIGPHVCDACYAAISPRMIERIIKVLFTAGDGEPAEHLRMHNDRGRYLGGYSKAGLRSTLGQIALPAPKKASKTK